MQLFKDFHAWQPSFQIACWFNIGLDNCLIFSSFQILKCLFANLFRFTLHPKNFSWWTLPKFFLNWLMHCCASWRPAYLQFLLRWGLFPPYIVWLNNSFFLSKFRHLQPIYYFNAGAVLHFWRYWRPHSKLTDCLCHRLSTLLIVNYRWLNIFAD